MQQWAAAFARAAGGDASAFASDSDLQLLLGDH